MKAYLITTGTLFGLLASLHLLRSIVEWRTATGPWFLLESLIGLIAAALSVWAMLLLRRPARY
ncbi:MAG: hypothetical protein ACP5XB_13660 [Isosphaeraceae bacterium]